MDFAAERCFPYLPLPPPYLPPIGVNAGEIHRFGAHVLHLLAHVLELFPPMICDFRCSCFARFAHILELFPHKDLRFGSSLIALVGPPQP